jgi:hypothetical protein
MLSLQRRIILALLVRQIKAAFVSHENDHGGHHCPFLFLLFVGGGLLGVTG